MEICIFLSFSYWDTYMNILLKYLLEALIIVIYNVLWFCNTIHNYLRYVYIYIFRSRVSDSMIIELCILWSDVFLSISSILFLSHKQVTKVIILSNTLFFSGTDVCMLYVCMLACVYTKDITHKCVYGGQSYILGVSHCSSPPPHYY